MDQPSFHQFNQDSMYQWIEDMANMGPRRAGSQAGLQCEDYLIKKLTDFGLENIQKEPIPVESWECHNHSLDVYNGTGYQNIAAQWLPYCAFTSGQGLEAELVYADPSKFIQGGSWKGKIVVTDICFPKLDVQLLRKFSFGFYDPDDNMDKIDHPATWVRINWHFYKKAFQKGAVGFIGILKDQPGGSYRMYAPYGFKEKDILDKPIPGFWVSRNDGSFLRDAAKKGVKAKMKIEGSRKPAVTHNVMGEIPGQSDETVVIHCHHDSPFMSPVEDASGCAVILAIAEYLAKQNDLKRKILVLLTAGHFYGSIGTRQFIEKHMNDIVRNVALEITVEHIAKEAIEDKDGNLVESGEPEGTGIFVPFNQAMVDAVMKNLEKNQVNRVFLLPPEGPLGDYPPTDGGDWYEAGIPLINVISNPVYLLNEEDDFHWVLKERLPRVAGFVTDLVREVDSMDKETIARVEFKGFKRKMKLIKKLARAKNTKFGTRPVY